MITKKKIYLCIAALLICVALLFSATACGTPGGTPDDGEYTVTFDANGGTLTGDAVVTVAAGGKISAIPTAERAEYLFDGWYSSPSGGINVDPAEYTVTTNVTFYALWTVEAEEEEPGPDDPSAEKTVRQIKVGKTPKSQFFKGDALELTGGTLEITYSDRNTEEIAIDAEGVTATVSGKPLAETDTSKTGSKSVSISYGGRTCRFTLYIVDYWTITLDMDGSAEDAAVKTMRGEPFARPEAPVAEGAEFYEWYSDEARTVAYDFSQVINGDTTIYAEWKEDGTTYYEFEYDLGYYGCAPDSYTQLVEAGQSPRALPFEPERAEYEFTGWTVNGGAMDASVTVTADTVALASWKRTTSGPKTYSFQAEETDLTGKTGHGLSGTATGTGMIVLDGGGSLGAEGGAYLSYLYTPKMTISFRIASDKKVMDAVLTIRMAAELNNINLDSDNYQIKVNGKVLEYSRISLPTGAPFSDALSFSGVTLEEGANLIELVTNNNVNPEGEGMGTYQATAPILDCIKINTDAVLIWDANYGLPK